MPQNMPSANLSLAVLIKHTTSGTLETFEIFARKADLNLEVERSFVGSGVYGLAVRIPSNKWVPTVMKIVRLETHDMSAAALEYTTPISEFRKELAITNRLSGKK